jgi:hypothetical protein
MVKMPNIIKETLDVLAKRLEHEANMYLNLSPKNYFNIRPLANIYEQAIIIDELSAIINVEVKTDFIKDWL